MTQFEFHLFLRISVIKENGAQIKLKVSSDILPSQILELCKVKILIFTYI